MTLIPTSIEVQLTIANLGLRVGDLAADPPEWLFDGADEVDPDGSLIKGRGGALFREKMLFRSTTDRRVIVDDSKGSTARVEVAVPVGSYRGPAVACPNSRSSIPSDSRSAREPARTDR